MTNIIVLMTDEHNPFYSSVYGHPFIKTPNMDRMARMGTLYQNTYCPSPLCLPSRSAFMTGKRVHELQTYSNCNLQLSPDFLAYGGLLSQQGVHSVHIGKTDVHLKGESLGFSEIKLWKDRALPGDTNFNRRPVSIREDAHKRVDRYGVKDDAFKGDLKVIDTALSWLDEVAPTLKQPWSLCINILNPHFPQWNTQELWDMYPEGDLPEYDGECESGNHPYALDLKKHFQLEYMTEEHARGIRRGYYGNVSFVDQQLGRLLDYLEEADQLDKTNIIFTSDHGEMLGKFGLWWKNSLYEDSVRVPCIAAGPGFVAGKVVTTPVDLHDVQASIFASVGAKRPVDWVGQPLQEVATADEERVVFAEYHGHGTRSGAYLVRKGDWKLIYYAEAPHQLFNLVDDPDELTNLYSQAPQKAGEMEEELRKICNPEEQNDIAHRFQAEQLEMMKTNYNR